MDRRRYHDGEIDVQRKAGVREVARRRGRNVVAEVPEAARAFLRERRMVVLGTVDEEGRPWASILTGRPGFATAPEPRVVRIAARPVEGDPLRQSRCTSEFAGLVAVDFATRRRIRVNGRLQVEDDGAMVIRTDQVYSNCPKYIQSRETREACEPSTAVEVARSHALTDAQRAWIRRADTFFIGTANPGEGADASHRGGPPGFVDVEDDRISWPDYRGNSMFNTLGNIAVHPWAGLVFPDFEIGAAILLTGRASIDWDADRKREQPGAERIVTVRAREVVEIRGGLPLRSRLTEYSPHNPDP